MPSAPYLRVSSYHTHCSASSAIHSLFPLSWTSFPSQKETPPAQCISPRHLTPLLDRSVQSLTSALQPNNNSPGFPTCWFFIELSAYGCRGSDHLTIRFDSTARNSSPPWTLATRPHGHGETSYRVIAIQTRQTFNGQSKGQLSLDRPPSAAFRSHKLHEQARERLGKTRTCRDRQEFGPPSSSSSSRRLYFTVINPFSR